MVVVLVMQMDYAHTTPVCVSVSNSLFQRLFDSHSEMLFIGDGWRQAPCGELLVTLSIEPVDKAVVNRDNHPYEVFSLCFSVIV